MGLCEYCGERPGDHCVIDDDQDGGSVMCCVQCHPDQDYIEALTMTDATQPPQGRDELVLVPPDQTKVPRIEVHRGPAHLQVGTNVTLCGKPSPPGTISLPDRDWRPPKTCPREEVCAECLKVLEAPIDIHLTDKTEFSATAKVPAELVPPQTSTNNPLLRQAPAWLQEVIVAHLKDIPQTEEVILAITADISDQAARAVGHMLGCCDVTTKARFVKAHEPSNSTTL